MEYVITSFPQNPPSACVETALLNSDTDEIADQTTAGHMVDRTEAFSSDFALIAATGEYGPMHGVIGRVRLLSLRSAIGTYRESGVGGHVRAVECVPSLDLNLGWWPSDAACYNFLYEIQGHFIGAAQHRSPGLAHSQWIVYGTIRVVRPAYVDG
jgi:hypothetical protein